MQRPGCVNVYKGGVMQINVYKDKCTELLEMMEMWSQKLSQMESIKPIVQNSAII